MINRNKVYTPPKMTTRDNPGKETKTSPREQRSNTKARKSTKPQKEIIPYKWLPDRILELRKKLTLSQAKFATLLKVSAGTVTNWEQGYTTPSETSQRKLNKIRAKL